MNKTLIVNATKARKDLFNLMDMVANSNLQVVLTKEGLKEKLVLKKLNDITYNSSLEEQKRIVADTAGSLSGNVYNPKENDAAAKIFVKEYKKKHEKL